MRFSWTFTLGFAAFTVSTVAAPRLAQACGGTFCDTGGPQAMPVDQTGENIVFVIQSGTVEAHIQIQYRGDAPRFSWVLPVPAKPEFEVGCQALFDRLLAATVPTYSVTTQQDFCGDSVTGAGTTGGTGGSSGSGPEGQPPVVVLHQTVGAFDVTVLQGGSADTVLNWLSINGYQTTPNASPLLQEYVAKGYLFLAVKLVGGSGVDEIHPLVVRYPGTEPCVPIKLTGVAAVEDMGIRTMFLGTKRVVPKNYKHIVPNVLKLDWFNSSSAYNTLVGRAADSPVANGQGFVTEYAGPTALVGAMAIASPSWNAAPFVTINPVGVIDLLENQQLLNCTDGFCSYSNPLLLPILREYLPAPATLNVKGQILVDPVAVEGYFYSCLACYASLINQSRWNGTEFAAKLSERIINPSRHADTLLSTWPYLTRMFTTMSPAEMTLDPEFAEHDGLPGQLLISANASQRIACGGASAVATLPDKRSVALPASFTWPRFSNDMPWAERIEEFGATGEAVVLVDNRQRIDDQLKAWNDSQHVSTPIPGTGGTDGGANAALSVDGNGCGCIIGKTSPTRPVWALAAFLGLATFARRRRSS